MEVGRPVWVANKDEGWFQGIVTKKVPQPQMSTCPPKPGTLGHSRHENNYISPQARSG